MENSINSVRVVRRAERVRKEAEFQKAIADGMSYEAQVKLREEHLQEERDSSFSDPEYMKEIEVAIANGKKMARFEKLRTKYRDSLDEYVTGKASLASHISMLEGLMNGEKDPDLLNEMRTLMSTAKSDQAKLELNAIVNRSSLAQKDGSIALVEASIKEVKERRARDLVNGNDDAVASWDETLLALNTSRSNLRIENAQSEFVFRSNKGGLKASDKLGLLNKEIENADAGTPVTFKGVRYPSERAYWENERNTYINSSYFTEVQSELDAETNTIAAQSPLGQIPLARIDAVNTFYKNLASRTEFLPYAERIEQERVASMNKMAQDLQKSVQTEFDSSEGTSQDVARYEAATKAIESKAGISLPRLAFEQAGGEKSVTEMLGKTPATKEPATTVKPPTTQELMAAYDPNKPFTPDQLAGLTPLNTIKTPTTPTATPPQTPSAPAEKPAETPPVKSVATTVSTPTPPVTPTTPETKPTPYSGVSLVDYLKSVGKDSSKEARAKLAAENGITNYDYSGEQNTQLLTKLRGF